MLRAIVLATLGAALLAGCGSRQKDRSLSGGAIGAGIGAIGGPVGLLVGGAVGAGAGAFTNEEQIDLGDPIWE
jgi:hypothetical protein